jgi:hypothetical protein
MNRIPHHYLSKFVGLMLACLFSGDIAYAQATAFTYQGKLTDAGNPANGAYDLQFRLFDTLSNGNQVGSTIVREDVQVANGIFSTALDFGAAAFPGASRFLEIAVRPGASTGAFTTLSPLQPLTSTPYAITSLNAGTATNFSGALSGDVTGTQNATSVIALRGKMIAATSPASGQVLKFNATTNQYEPTADNNSGGTITSVSAGAGLSGGGTSGSISLGIVPGGVSVIELASNAVTAAKIAAGQVVKSLNGLTDAVTLVAGSNITITPAGKTLTIAAANSNAILNQTALQAGANFNIGGNGAVGGTLTGNIVNAATQFNLNGQRVLSVAGTDNLFVGRGAGVTNIDGSKNAFFGTYAGQSNTSGSFNTFFGTEAGQSNTSGSSNTFFGKASGNLNSTGHNNTFFGMSAGYFNTTGYNNALFGAYAGQSTTTGSSNTFFGTSAGTNNSTGSYNSFFGTSAGANNITGQSNIFFGSFAGMKNTTGSGNVFFGTDTGSSNTTGQLNTFIGESANFNTSDPTGNKNTLLGAYTLVNSGVTNGSAIGAQALVAQSNSLVLGSISGINGAGANTNVGIGTTSPSSRLHVVGEIKIDGIGNGLRFADGTVQTSAAVGGVTNISVNAPLASTGGATPNISLSGIVPIANGGTGIGSGPTIAGQFLRSSGANTWAAGSIQISDLPTGVYIQNTQALQSGANFNISGDGVAGGTLSGNIVNAITRYNLNGNTFLMVNGLNSGNTFVGIGAGTSTIPGGVNASGNLNSFFGTNAGNANTTGYGNSFFGTSAGKINITGYGNSFFGASAGSSTTSGYGNSFFGEQSGSANNGNFNSYFGQAAGAEGRAVATHSSDGLQDKQTLAALTHFLGKRPAIVIQATTTISSDIWLVELTQRAASTLSLGLIQVELTQRVPITPFSGIRRAEPIQRATSTHLSEMGQVLSTQRVAIMPFLGRVPVGWFK